MSQPVVENTPAVVLALVTVILLIVLASAVLRFGKLADMILEHFNVQGFSNQVKVFVVALVPPALVAAAVLILAAAYSTIRGEE